MKRKKQVVIFAALLAASVWTAPTFAQLGGDEGSQFGFGDRLESSFDAVDHPGDRLLARALNNLEELPEDVQADVLALRDSLQELKAIWIAEYRPGVGATLEQIQAARAEFQADHAAEIEANKQLRISLVSELRVNLQARFGDEEWSQEARVLMQQYNEIKLQLAVGWRETLAELGGDATREDILAARARFNEENAELIAQQKELALQVRALVRENRGNGRALADRDAVPETLTTLREEIAVLRNQIRERKQAAREELKGMSRQEREAYRQALLDQLKNDLDGIKERRRQVIRDLGGDQDGDRRPEG